MFPPLPVLPACGFVAQFVASGRHAFESRQSLNPCFTFLFFCNGRKLQLISENHRFTCFSLPVIRFASKRQKYLVLTGSKAMTYLNNDPLLPLALVVTFTWWAVMDITAPNGIVLRPNHFSSNPFGSLLFLSIFFFFDWLGRGIIPIKEKINW